MKNLLLLLNLLLLFPSLYGQTGLRVTMPQYGLRLDTVPFEISRVVDNTSQEFCGFFENRAGVKMPYFIKGGIAKRFEKYFSKADNGAVVGDKKLVAIFNQLQVEIRNEKGKKGMQIKQLLDIDFYEISQEDKLSFVLNYTAERDTSIRGFDLNLKKSTYPMMQEVYQLLSNHYVNPNNTQPPQLAKFMPQTNDTATNTVKEIPQEFQAVSQLPETKRINRIMDIISYEQFYSSKLRGYRGRYGAAFKTDSSKWWGLASAGFEVLDLYEEFDGSDGVYDVLFSYFGFGLGAISRIDDALAFELDAKFVFGSEQISRDPFLMRYSSNTIFGFHLVERLHLVVGENGGLLFTGGLYQNFNAGSEYVPTDFGVLWGVGIHF